MENLLYLLPVLACPIGMGIVMWIMMRPKNHRATGQSTLSGAERELTQLREEVQTLRERRADTEPTPDRTRPVSR